MRTVSSSLNEGGYGSEFEGTWRREIESYNGLAMSGEACTIRLEIYTTAMPTSTSPAGGPGGAW